MALMCEKSKGSIKFHIPFYFASIFCFLRCYTTIAETRIHHEQKPDHRHLTLGGLFPIRRTAANGKCSQRFSLYGVKRFMAMTFAVDRINADDTILPNSTLHVKLFDTCARLTTALEHVLKQFLWSCSCNSTNHCVPVPKSVVGVVGPPSSDEAVGITNALGIFHIPIISYSATSPELSDKSKYEYFSRTAPSDVFQIKAIVDLLKFYNWTYINVVYSNEPYGSTLFRLLQKEGEKHGICISFEGQIPEYYDETRYDSVIEELLLSNESSEIVVLFCAERALLPLLINMMEHIDIFKSMQFIGSDTMNVISMENIQAMMSGMILIQFISEKYDEFEEYFLGLTVNRTDERNWFKDFYAEVMNCSFKDEGTQLSPENFCNLNRTLGSNLYANKHFDEDRVIDAVYAFAHALHQIKKDDCLDISANCSSLEDMYGDLLLRTIRNLSFTSPIGNKTVQFDSNGDVEGGYEIYYVQDDGAKSNLSHVKIGTWTGKLHMNAAAERPPKFASVKSRCSESCTVLQVQRTIRGKPPCCWSCEVCPPNAVIFNKTTCHVCEKGYMPDEHLRSCVLVEVIYYGVDGKALPVSLVIPPLVLSAVGILAASFTVCVFLKFNNTPLVKASGRELCYLLLVGLFLSFIFSFVCIVKPSQFKCSLQFILDSLPTTMSYVAIAIKTNRVFRIFDDKRIITKRPNLVSPISQISLCFGLISFQVLLLVMLMILHFPTEELIYPTFADAHVVCSTPKTHVQLSHLFNFILIISCSYYSYKARKIPRNFNETKYIAFAMYASLVLMVAFFVVAVISSKNSNGFQEQAIDSYRVTLMSTVLLVCFFAPKIYIILFRPEENVKYRVSFAPTVEFRTDEPRNEILDGRSDSRNTTEETLADGLEATEKDASTQTEQ